MNKKPDTNNTVLSPRPYTADKPMDLIPIQLDPNQTYLPGQEPEPSIAFYDLRCGDCPGEPCNGTDYEGDYDHCPIGGQTNLFRSHA